MALPPSGRLSLDDIQTEFGGDNPIYLSEYYGVDDGVPTEGQISVSDFHGTEAPPKEEEWDVVGDYQWVVPAGVSSVNLCMIGGGGGGGTKTAEGSNGKGGKAGTIISEAVAVTPGATIDIKVGYYGEGENFETHGSGGTSRFHGKYAAGGMADAHSGTGYSTTNCYGTFNDGVKTTNAWGGEAGFADGGDANETNGAYGSRGSGGGGANFGHGGNGGAGVVRIDWSGGAPYVTLSDPPRLFPVDEIFNPIPVSEILSPETLSNLNGRVLPDPGVALSFSEIQTEFGGDNPISLTEYYGEDPDLPTEGRIAVSDFYGTGGGEPPAGDKYVGYPTDENGVPLDAVGDWQEYGTSGSKVYATNVTMTEAGTAVAVNIRAVNPSVLGGNSYVVLYKDEYLIGSAEIYDNPPNDWSGYIDITVEAGMSLDFNVGDILYFGLSNPEYTVGLISNEDDGGEITKVKYSSDTFTDKPPTFIDGWSTSGSNYDLGSVLKYTPS